MMNLYAVEPWMQTEGMCQSGHFDGIHCWLNQAKSNKFEEGKENLGFADLTIGDSTSVPIQQKCNAASSLVFYTPALMLCESEKASNLPQVNLLSPINSHSAQLFKSVPNIFWRLIYPIHVYFMILWLMLGTKHMHCLSYSI